MDTVSLELLKNSKFTDKQARVYLALLQLGKGSVSQIATEAELKRSITYVVIEELARMGYVNLDPEISARKVYTATDPNIIATQIEQTARDFTEMLPYLRAMQRRGGKPYVSYYSGVEGSKAAFAQIRRPKTARYALSVQEVEKHIPGEVERWKKAYLNRKAGPDGRHLLTDTGEDRVYGESIAQVNQEVRYLKPGLHLGMDLALVDNRVFLTTFTDGIHVTVIESESLYNSLCVLFDLAWESSIKK